MRFELTPREFARMVGDRDGRVPCLRPRSRQFSGHMTQAGVMIRDAGIEVVEDDGVRRFECWVDIDGPTVGPFDDVDPCDEGATE